MIYIITAIIYVCGAYLSHKMFYDLEFDCAIEYKRPLNNKAIIIGTLIWPLIAMFFMLHDLTNKKYLK